jgi:YVTN family beta-propeller protein
MVMLLVGVTACASDSSTESAQSAQSAATTSTTERDATETTDTTAATAATTTTEATKPSSASAVDEVTDTFALVGVPLDLAVSPDGSQLYLLEAAGDVATVSVFDRASATVVRTVPFGESPDSLVLSPDGSRIYADDQAQDMVSVIDPNGGTVSGTISLGLNTTTGNVSGFGLMPEAMALSPDGSRLYVAEFAASWLAVIDTATGAVLEPITVGPYPIDVAVSPDGSAAYVLENTGNLSIVDLMSGAVTQTIAVGGGPTEVEVSPDGATVYVINTVPGELLVIDASSGTLTQSIPLVGDYSMEMAPDGQLYVTMGPVGFVGVEGLSTLDVGDRALGSTLPLEERPYQLAVSADGSWVYVLGLDEQGINATVSVVKRS